MRPSARGGHRGWGATHPPCAEAVFLLRSLTKLTHGTCFYTDLTESWLPVEASPKHGYGFVEYFLPQSAAHAIRSMHGFPLAGGALPADCQHQIPEVALMTKPISSLFLPIPIP